VAEVDVGSGGIEADFDRERLPARNFRLQIVLFDEVYGAFGEVGQLLVEIHGGRLSAMLHTQMNIIRAHRHHHHHRQR
jgi:hypothetical protein